MVVGFGPEKLFRIKENRRKGRSPRVASFPSSKFVTDVRECKPEGSPQSGTMPFHGLPQPKFLQVPKIPADRRQCKQRYRRYYSGDPSWENEPQLGRYSAHGSKCHAKWFQSGRKVPLSLSPLGRT